jgi:hypothetical protein
MATHRASGARPRLTILVTALGMSCAGIPDAGIGPDAEITCSIPRDLIFDGGPGKDGIPALTNPRLVTDLEPGAAYLRPEDRVIGFVVDGTAIAVPLNIGWWHEIVNFDIGGRHLAITYCPLTGSGLGFDRAKAGNAEFGVSGLLFMNNLIMYDRRADESFWPQLSRGARCGAKIGTDLDMIPVIEITWEGWLTLYPSTKVVSSETGFRRDYNSYPYGNYDDQDNAGLLFPMPRVDPRRPPKERVLGIPHDSGGIAFPYGALAEAGQLAVVDTVLAGRRIAVFWDGTRQAAAAFRITSDSPARTFRAVDQRITDAETGSTWQVDGLATAGPLAGTRLAPVTEAYVVFWFAWAAFQPRADLWTPPGSTP